ncbi:hypothetical protein [Pseudomonas viridiflava]|uniref:hypothetical protein n=1 Tax=Pseudomonas viridiflava TaxID=33069 RepID=UPI0013CEBF55|nr:hypothetical protein [Pseudomonas viridiflava]MBI6684544.1 hypothetical protein [Pseudomonas viridiflava]MEE4947082.1 hypothetical protein [Pseudomonas alliivorans]
MRIKREYELQLINYIKAYSGFKSEKPIQYGVQYNVNDVILNFHYSDRDPSTFSLTIQNAPADPIFSQLIENFANGLIPTQQGIQKIPTA